MQRVNARRVTEKGSYQCELDRYKENIWKRQYNVGVGDGNRTDDLLIDGQVVGSIPTCLYTAVTIFPYLAYNFLVTHKGVPI